MSIPVKHKMVYERQKNRTRGNSEWLRLYIGCSNKAGSSYTTDLSLKDIFGLFRYTPQKLEITLSMGLTGELDVILTNMEDNESATIHIFRNAEVKGLMSV